MYKDELVKSINKALRDEISASIGYKAMSELAKGDKLTQAMSAHSNEEFAHFGAILSFSLNHGLKVTTEIDTKVVNEYPIDDDKMIPFVQNLETNAIADYKAIALMAREEGDLETESFFIEIMNDEIGHYDELSALSKSVRGVNETKMFRDLVK
jgi:ferritin